MLQVRIAMKAVEISTIVMIIILPSLVKRFIWGFCGNFNGPAEASRIIPATARPDPLVGCVVLSVAIVMSNWTIAQESRLLQMYQRLRRRHVPGPSLDEFLAPAWHSFKCALIRVDLFSDP